MSDDVLSADALTVLGALLDVAQPGDGHTPGEVKRRSELGGLDFNLALQELEESKLVRSRQNARIDISEWEFIREHRSEIGAAWKKVETARATRQAPSFSVGVE